MEKLSGQAKVWLSYDDDSNVAGLGKERQRTD